MNVMGYYFSSNNSLTHEEQTSRKGWDQLHKAFSCHRCPPKVSLPPVSVFQLFDTIEKFSVV